MQYKSWSTEPEWRPRTPADGSSPRKLYVFKRDSDGQDMIPSGLPPVVEFDFSRHKQHSFEAMKKNVDKIRDVLLVGDTQWWDTVTHNPYQAFDRDLFMNRNLSFAPQDEDAFFFSWMNMYSTPSIAYDTVQEIALSSVLREERFMPAITSERGEDRVLESIVERDGSMYNIETNASAPSDDGESGDENNPPDCCENPSFNNSQSSLDADDCDLTSAAAGLGEAEPDDTPMQPLMLLFKDEYQNVRIGRIENKESSSMTVLLYSPIDSKGKWGPTETSCEITHNEMDDDQIFYLTPSGNLPQRIKTELRRLISS